MFHCVELMFLEVILWLIAYLKKNTSIDCPTYFRSTFIAVQKVKIVVFIKIKLVIENTSGTYY